MFVKEEEISQQDPDIYQSIPRESTLNKDKGIKPTVDCVKGKLEGEILKNVNEEKWEVACILQDKTPHSMAAFDKYFIKIQKMVSETKKANKMEKGQQVLAAEQVLLENERQRRAKQLGKAKVSEMIQ